MLFSLLYLYVFHRGVVAPPSSGFYPIMIVFLPPATKLRQGNVFTPVCHSVHRGRVGPGVVSTRGCGHTPPWANTPPAQCILGYTPPAQCMLGYTPPAQCMLGYTPPPLHSACWNMVTKQAVRIPLECILVFFLIIMDSNRVFIESRHWCTVHAGIWSTSGRYASHWNAF